MLDKNSTAYQLMILEAEYAKIEAQLHAKLRA
jgi:hypothetical protein